MGDAFDLIQHASSQGIFDEVEGIDDLSDINLEAEYLSENVRVAAVNHSGFAGFRAFSFGGDSSEISKVGQTPAFFVRPGRKNVADSSESIA
jgi:hypothetical protein